MRDPTRLQNTSFHLHESKDSAWLTNHCGSESHLEKLVSQGLSPHRTMELTHHQELGAGRQLRLIKTQSRIS